MSAICQPYVSQYQPHVSHYQEHVRHMLAICQPHIIACQPHITKMSFTCLHMSATSSASILNQRVQKRTGFALVLNQTESHLVFLHKNQTKNKSLYFSNCKTKPKLNRLIFVFLKTKPNLI